CGRHPRRALDSARAIGHDGRALLWWTAVFWEYLHVGTTSPPVVERRLFSGKLWLGLGISLLLLGPALYVLQLQAKILTVPWYMPALATAGAAVLLLAVLG